MRGPWIPAGPALLALLALLALGCRYRPEPIPLAGSRGELQRLSGEWNGDYSSTQTFRDGIINFKLNARGDSASGEVMMLTTGNPKPMLPVDRAEEHFLHARSAELLSIRFVEVRGDEVRGVLEPYIAPDCDCVARTTFIGKARGDVITGTFMTRIDGHPEQVGRWQVKRIGR